MVELPGIEPATEMALTCGNVGNDYAKQREMTWGYAKGVDGVNTFDRWRSSFVSEPLPASHRAARSSESDPEIRTLK
jgi:hypothetical protein